MRNPRLLLVDNSGALLPQLQAATAAVRPHIEVFHCEAVAQLAAAVTEHGPFDVVIAGPVASSDEGLLALRQLRIQVPQTSLILAFDHWRGNSLRKTVRTGALDILRLPVSDDTLLEAIEEALSVRWPVPSAAGPTETRSKRHGIVIVVGSATGGCGKTFFSTNLAYYLRSRLQKRTCLIDLDLQFGELSTALRLKPRQTIADLVAADDGDAGSFEDRLEEAMVSHETGISVLAAPDAPAEADAMDAADVSRVIAAAAARFDCVIIDTPAALSEGVLAAVEQAEVIFSIATLDLPSVRNLGVLLTTFNQLKVDASRIQLVMNKVEEDVGMDVASVARYFPMGFSTVIPYGREVNRSLNMGVPMLAFAPHSEVSRALVAGFAKSLDIDGIDTAEVTPVKPDRRRRLLGRHTANSG